MTTRGDSLGSRPEPRGIVPVEPGFEFAFEARGALGEPSEVGSTVAGATWVVPIMSGPFHGPGIAGQLYGSGFDWQSTSETGLTAVDASYVLSTDDGVLIRVRNRGMRRPERGSDGAPAGVYFRCVPEFTAPRGRYEWLNESIFVCTGARLPLEIVLWFFRVT